MNCVFASLEKGTPCTMCGRVLKMTFRDHPHALCKVKGAGDALEELLTNHGVTKEWWVEVKEKFGLPPTCNCEARKKWINDVSSEHPVISGMCTKILAALTRR